MTQSTVDIEGPGPSLGDPRVATDDTVVRRKVSSTPGGWLRRGFYHGLFRILTGLLCVTVRLCKRFVTPRPAPKDGRLRMVVTGRIFTRNWATAHLRPLAASARCAEVLFVSTHPVPEIPKVRTIYPPDWLVRLIGGSPARLLVFAWIVLSQRPDVVGGFHMKINGLVAIVLAAATGARSLYFCVGGPAEVLDGGIWGEAKTFERMETPDAVVEARLLAAAGQADLIVTMGTRAMRFFRSRGVAAAIQVVPGGIDPDEFSPGDANRPFDVLLVGRLVEVKRIDVYLDAIRIVADEMPGVRAAIIGGGSRLDAQLHEQAKRLQLETIVTFAGHTEDVAGWLRQAKLLAMTSDSEGLPLAVMQAMMAGLPAVASNVGDVADLVADGVNGYLAPRRSPRDFAKGIISLLQDEDRLARFSRAARESALKFTTARTVEQWDRILGEFRRTNG